MIVEREYYVKLSEIGKENKITNKALLGILEDIGGIHSNIAGYGIPTMDKTHLTWILLDWKVQVIRRPNYAEKILARTWSKEGLKYYAYRDFEVVDEQGNDKRRAEIISIFNMGVNLVEIVFLFGSAYVANLGTMVCFIVIGITMILLGNLSIVFKPFSK